MKGPPGGPGCQIIKTRSKCYIVTFWTLVRLLSCFSIDLQYVCCVRGGEGYVPSALGFRKGDGDETADWLGRWTFTGGNSEVLIPTFFLHTTHCLSGFDPVVSATNGRHIFFVLHTYALWPST